MIGRCGGACAIFLAWSSESALGLNMSACVDDDGEGAPAMHASKKKDLDRNS